MYRPSLKYPIPQFSIVGSPLLPTLTIKTIFNQSIVIGKIGHYRQMMTLILVNRIQYISYHIIYHIYYII